MVDVRVPILVGVTGHRDIPSDDKLVIREAIRLRLTELHEEYPHSPFRLISGLAEGADRLVAEVALEIDDFSLLAALPMEQAEYEKDFETPASLECFRRLISLADRCFVVEATEGDNEHGLLRDEKYLTLGRYIARHSQIVIALWDGVTGQIMPDGQTQILMGGTADVVRLCRSGLLSTNTDQIVLPKITRVDHLYVRRTRRTETQGDHQVLQAGEWVVISNASERKSRSQSKAVLLAIDRFNECAGKFTSDELNKTRGWLIGSNAPKAATEHLASPIAIFSSADAAAGLRQTGRSLAIKRISALAIISIICQQIYSGPDMRWGWLASHIVLAFLAFFAFLYFFKGKHPREEQYLDWRALAEGVRVQIFWLASGVRGSAAEYYLSGDRDELDWIRQAVHNSVVGISPINSQETMKWVRDVWLESQRGYFTKKAPDNDISRRRFSKLTNLLFVAALIITLVTLLINLAGASELILNGLVLASGVCFLLSAVLKAYADQMAFEEQQNRYQGMSEIFKMALNRYDDLITSGDCDRARVVLFNIGKEALTENAGWLRLHRQRQFEVNIGG